MPDAIQLNNVCQMSQDSEALRDIWRHATDLVRSSPSDRIRDITGLICCVAMVQLLLCHSFVCKYTQTKTQT